MSPYFFAKLVFDIVPRRLLAAFVYSCISYWMIGGVVCAIVNVIILFQVHINTYRILLVNSHCLHSSHSYIRAVAYVSECAYKSVNNVCLKYACK